MNFFLGRSSILLLFCYLAPLQNDSIVTSQFMQFTFGEKREVYLLNESALPVTEKESMQEGKKSFGPRMKYGHTNLVTSRWSHFAVGLSNKNPGVLKRAASC